MKEIRIIVRCVREPRTHAKIIRVKAKLGKRKAEELAELIDGTSMMYVHRPGQNSPIGKCCTCGAAVETEVTEVLDAPNGCAEASENES